MLVLATRFECGIVATGWLLPHAVDSQSEYRRLSDKTADLKAQSYHVLLVVN